MTELVRRKCRYCGNEVILGVRGNGHKVELDPGHDPNGRWRLTEGLARKSDPTMSMLDDDDGLRYHRHEDTCPAWGVKPA